MVTGRGIFLVPDIRTRWKIKLDNDTARKNEILLRYEFTERDTVLIDLPSGYRTESMPAPVSPEGKFGKYSCLAKIETGKMIYYWTLVQD